jgi:serine/threonine-protein kinase
MIGNFRIEKKIGQGGFGAVYQAINVHLDQDVAIKVLNLSKRADASLVERFRREARAIAKLTHDNVVHLFDFGLLNDEQGFYLVMELLKGKGLDKSMEDRDPFPLLQIKSMMQQICAVLFHAHRMGIIHRDLKPANIFLVTDEIHNNKVKVIDFGIAAVTEDDGELTQSGIIMGSPHYMSPEQAIGDSRLVDGRSDLYSLGIILYQLLTGTTPFQGHSNALLYQHVQSIPPSLSQTQPNREWTPKLERFLSRAMAKKPEQRPVDAATFWEECAAALDAQIELEPAIDDSEIRFLQQSALGSGGFSVTPSLHVAASTNTPSGSRAASSMPETVALSQARASADRANVSHTKTPFRNPRSFATKLALIFVPLLLLLAAVGWWFLFGAGSSSALSAQVWIRSEPPNAEVWLNEKKQGETPLYWRGKAGQQVELRLVRLGYQPFNTKHTLQPDLQTWYYSLKPQEVTVLISSTPSNADIYVGERVIGQTPYTINGVTDTPMVFRLELKGHKAVSVQSKFTTDRSDLHYKLEPITRQETPPVVQRPITRQETPPVVHRPRPYTPPPSSVKRARLQIESHPAGAEVFINGKKVGITPYTFTGTAGQSITVTLYRKGFIKQDKRLKLQPGYEKKSYKLENVNIIEY